MGLVAPGPLIGAIPVAPTAGGYEMARKLGFMLLGGMLANVTLMGAAWAAAPVEVPEPSSLALIAIGIGGVAYLKFRQRK